MSKPKALIDVLPDDLNPDGPNDDINPATLDLSTETLTAMVYQELLNSVDHDGDGLEITQDDCLSLLEKLSNDERSVILAAINSGYILDVYQTENGIRGMIAGYRCPATRLMPNTWNHNEQTARQQEAVGESLNSLGQLIEVIVRVHPTQPDRLEILDGEHRFNVLSGKAKVNIVFGYSLAECKKITVVMNETRGEANMVKLAAVLKDIELEIGADDLGYGLPYTESELGDIKALADIDWDKFGSDDGDDDSDDDADSDEDGGKGSDSTTNDASDDEDEDWVTIKARIPHSVHELLKQVYDLVLQERGRLHVDKSIAWGQVIESMTADYLATPRLESSTSQEVDYLATPRQPQE